jgi:hypothetical protein
MSTMYDALRKAEAEHKKAAGLKDKEPEGKAYTAAQGIPDSAKTAVLLLAVIIVFGIAFYRIKGLQASSKPVAAETAASNQVVVASSTTNPQQRAPGTYGLDGVINAGSNSMAIVNGKLLKVDGTIDSLVLKKISPKEVELLNTKDNSTVILRIN